MSGLRIRLAGRIQAGLPGHHVPAGDFLAVQIDHDPAAVGSRDSKAFAAGWISHFEPAADEDEFAGLVIEALAPAGSHPLAVVKAGLHPVSAGRLGQEKLARLLHGVVRFVQAKFAAAPRVVLLRLVDHALDLAGRGDVLGRAADQADAPQVLLQIERGRAGVRCGALCCGHMHKPPDHGRHRQRPTQMRNHKGPPGPTRTRS